jgi:hypothetical protein
LFIANYKFIIPDEDFVILAVSVVLFLKYPWWSSAVKEAHENSVFIRKVLVLRSIAPYRSVNNFAGYCCFLFQGMRSSKTRVACSSETSINIEHFARNFPKRNESSSTPLWEPETSQGIYNNIKYYY